MIQARCTVLPLIAGLVLAGCAGTPKTHTNLTPTKAISAIATDHDPSARIIDTDGMIITITI